MIQRAQTLIKNIFGYDDFRPLQQEIIANVLDKNDSLVIMPTGGGKSLCYQIPALIFEGLTIVVSPLISLMKDQVEQMRELGVSAIFLNSSLSYQAYQRNLELVKQNKVKLLYVAPETLFKPNILALLESVRIDCLTIDEAHCISEWGHDFRPDYRQLVTVRERFSETVCVALTATATQRVQADIKSTLGFVDSNEFIASFDRENLFLQVVPKESPFEQTVAFLERFPDQSGIIYCFSRRQVDELSAALEQEGFSVKPYHAGMQEADRMRNQDLFIRDDVSIIVATVAFGMGINKPNIRFVLHYDLPKNIESYYQEIGRAGRDGLRSDCLLLLGYADIQKIRYLIDQKEGQERYVANAHLNAMLRFAETHICRRKPLLKYFGETYEPEDCGMCDNCVGESKELHDVTVPAQKFLSCVYRTGQIYGANHVIDVLRGSKSEKVLKKGHGNLSTYGIGRELSKKQWLHLSRQFIQQELLEQDLEYGGLRLTDKADAVLRERQAVYGIIEQEKIDVGKTTEPAPEHDRELFEILRAKRKSVSDLANLPPYMIFSDKSLVEMATYFPQSEASLLTIHGVGRVKAEKYGATFLSLIYGYCKQKGLQEKPKGRRAPAKKSQMGKRKHLIIGDAFNAGDSVTKIMRDHGIKQSTVLRHLHQYLTEGHPLRGDEFLQLSSLSRDQQNTVLQAFDRHGADFLRPVYDALDGQIEFDELRLLQLYYLSEQG